MNRVSLLVLNLQTLASTVITIPIEVSSHNLKLDLQVSLALADTVRESG